MARKVLLVIIGILIVAGIAGGLVGVKLLQFRKMADVGAQQVMPPTVVNAYRINRQTWHPEVSAVGSVVAMQGTVVSTEAEGIVRDIHFQAGSMAQAGDALVQLDIDLEQAQLREAQAAAELARISLRRAQELIKTRNIARSELDSASSSVKQADAQVDYVRAVIAKKTVRAPFTGQLGIRRISIGQFLEKGTPVVSLQSLDPIYVEFSLPQQRLGELTGGLQVRVSSDAYPGRTFDGRVSAFNPDLDPNTRTVRVQATLANPDGRLRPGMFVSMDMVLAHVEQVLLIPETAVLHGPYGDSVFVIEEGPPAPDGGKTLRLRQQLVQLGARRGDFVVVTDGVKEGERVVSTGVFKLRSGMTVVIDNSLAPDFKLQPSPRNT